VAETKTCGVADAADLPSSSVTSTNPAGRAAHRTPPTGCRRVSQDADPPDRATCAFGDHRDGTPEGNWLTRAPSLAAQGDSDGQGARRKPDTASTCTPRRRRWRRSRRYDDEKLIEGSRSTRRSSLSHAELRRRRRHRLAGGDGAAICNQVPLCRSSYGHVDARRDAPGLQGGVLSPSARASSC